MFPANVANVSFVLRGRRDPNRLNKWLISLVQLGGLEPPTSGSTIRRSNQLSYSCTKACVFGQARGPYVQHPFLARVAAHHSWSCGARVAFKKESPGNWPGLERYDSTDT